MRLANDRGIAPTIRIPYGIGDFKEIREGGYYYIDKTQFIDALEAYKVPVFLRPRRFGKSLLCSTLSCYYDINLKDSFNSYFGDLEVGKNPTGNQSRYMVLSFDFSKIPVSTDIQKLESNFRKECLSLMELFLSRYDSLFEGRFTLNKDDSVATNLSLLLTHIQQYNLPSLYLIIDEYDNFSNQFVNTKRDDLYKDVTTGTSFFKTFFKVIKAGVGNQSIAGVFITGVLPITMDDLTSGFNIAEFITLKSKFHTMLGFTQMEVEQYLTDVFECYNFDTKTLSSVIELAKSYYNGYCFVVGAEERLYNTTILSYFIKSYIDEERLPSEMIDSNIKTDVNWIQRLAGKSEDAVSMLSSLINEKKLPYDKSLLSSKFNMNQFFEREYFPIALFYMGLLTVSTPFQMVLPNQTIATLCAEYYNTLSKISVSEGYTGYFEKFLETDDLKELFAGYYKTYIGQIPAQVFDKVNENFYRTTFFEICTRYLSDYYTFAIEVNRPTGRSDWEMLGRPDTAYKNLMHLVEFKYYPIKREREFEALKAAEVEHVAQVDAYADGVALNFPQYRVRKHICYVCANRGFKWFEVGDS